MRTALAAPRRGRPIDESAQADGPRRRPGPIIEAALERGISLAALARRTNCDYTDLVRNRLMPLDQIDALQATLDEESR